MGLYKQLSTLNRNKEDIIKFQRERLTEWRSQTSILRIDHPTNLLSARRLGYKAKPGFILVRIRIGRGGKQRPTVNKGRRSRNFGQRLVMGKSYQWVAEERVSKTYPNLEVLNSYKVGKDGISYWFEVILLDPHHPVIRADKDTKWVASGKHGGRAHRGLTSAGKKSRGMLHKGYGTEKTRPSLGAHIRTGK